MNLRMGVLAALGVGTLGFVSGCGGASPEVPTATATRAPSVASVEKPRASIPGQGSGTGYVPYGYRDSSGDAAEAHDLAALERRLRTELGARYAGVWQSGPHSPRATVGIVRPTARDRRLVPDYADVLPARFGFDHLERVQDEASAVIDGARDGDTGVMIDLARNAVVVLTAGLSEDTTRELAALGPAVVIQIEPGFDVSVGTGSP